MLHYLTPSCARSVIRAFALCIAGWCCNPVAVSAQDIAGTLTTAWESFWSQSGYPRGLYKWQGAIRVRFSGVSPERHKEFTIRQIQEVAKHAGISVSEVAQDDKTANVQVEFFGADAPLPASGPCVTNIIWRNYYITRATIKANDRFVWRCMLHETMHLMGFAGHPLYNSVLTYFARGSNLTTVDILLLKTLYSSDVASGASPFSFLQVLAQRLVDNSAEGEKNAAKQAADTFLRKTIQEMEAFGNGTGEGPSVIVRSGKMTQQGLERGQIEIQYFLGLAYVRGHIVAPDKDKAQYWLNKAAAASHGGATALLKVAAADEH